MMSAADTIKKIRTNLYLERIEFAKIIGVTRASVGYYETGKKIPKLAVIKKIRDLAKNNGMNYTVEDFLEN
jgi:transcriptional regulator with XRE-family HTH domain